MTSSTTDVSMGQDVAAVLQELVENPEQRATRLEETCKEQAEQIKELTEAFGKSRAEVIALEKRLQKMEEQALKWKLFRKGNMPVDDAGHGDGYQNDNGRKDPIAIFPEEIWSLIFGHLKEPQDFKSCYQTCTKFMWMLQDKRKNFLFLDVLKVVQNQGEGFNLATSQGLSRNRLSEIVKCRLVCHGWKQSVDTFLQENCPMNGSPVGRPDNQATAVLFASWNNPWSDLALRSLSADMNPMISRYVALEYISSPYWGPTPGETDRLHDAFLAFLRKFGHHVWHFKLSYQAWDVSFTTWYIGLLTWLRHMPNLKTLYLSVCRGDRRGNADAMTQCLTQNTFPALHSLKSVTLDCYPAQILESILTANPHIGKLQFLGAAINKPLNSFKLEKLSEVTLDIDSFSYVALEGVSWNLRKLTLEATNLVWSELFQFMETRFAGTLVELNLELRGPNHEPDLRLHLPSLRVLKLKIKECFNSIDFILPLASLEYLEVNLVEMHWNSISLPKEIVEFHDYIHNMKESNIWHLFPKLKKVRARTDGFEDSYGDWQYCSRNQVD